MNQGSDAAVTVNGIDTITGDYVPPGLTRHDLAAIARRGADDEPSSQELRARHGRATERLYAPRHGIDAADLRPSGVGRPLRRRCQSGRAGRPKSPARAPAASGWRPRRAPLYRVRGSEWSSPRRVQAVVHTPTRQWPGPVDPDIMPYYLLLVGNPEEIPFRVHAHLIVQHAVGRLSFDEVCGYRRYAESMVAAVTARPSRPPTTWRFARRRPEVQRRRPDPATSCMPSTSLPGKSLVQWAVPSRSRPSSPTTRQRWVSTSEPAVSQGPLACPIPVELDGNATHVVSPDHPAMPDARTAGRGRPPRAPDRVEPGRPDRVAGKRGEEGPE
jgi:hypothetical protein